MRYLKIKDKYNLDKLDKKFNLDTEIIDGDYESGYSGDIEHSKGGVFISEANKKIYGIDCSDLMLLYDLIKADIVEVVEE